MPPTANFRTRGGRRPDASAGSGIPVRSEGGAAEIEVRQVILGLVGERRGHGDFDPAHAAAYLGADLEQLEADRAAGGVANWVWRRPIRRNASAARRPARRTTGAVDWRAWWPLTSVGEQIQLLLLDAVLHLAAGTVYLFVQVSRRSVRP